MGLDDPKTFPGNITANGWRCEIFNMINGGLHIIQHMCNSLPSLIDNSLCETLLYLSKSEIRMHALEIVAACHLNLHCFIRVRTSASCDLRVDRIVSTHIQPRMRHIWM